MRKENAINTRPRTTHSRAYMSVEEFCADLGITRSTFYDWRTKRKAPPCLRLPNGELRIHRSDYETWIKTLAERAA